MDFLANENIPARSIELLREHGHTVYAVQQEHSGLDDPAVLALARARNAIVLTFDRDYGEMIYAKKLPSPPGVVYFRFIPRYPKEPAELLLEFLHIEEVKWLGHFTVLDRSKLRQRILPGLGSS